MNLSPEIKAQLAEQKKQCVFCKLVSGEIPAKTVFEDKLTIAMLDIYPVRKGHTIFLLKEHYPIMPYIPLDEFKKYFGLIPQLAKSIPKAIVNLSLNVFIANGGVAGQQAPHFLIHLLPRDEGDGFYNFLFKKTANLEEGKVKLLANNLLIMMQDHFGRNPVSWHNGKGGIPSFLQDLQDHSMIIYEDEKVLCVVPRKEIVSGHLEIYSKVEEKEITKLSAEDSAHLFFTASFASTVLFEGLKAQGTNIILKSGVTDDNPSGRLCLHVLPRKQDDGLDQLLWQPKQPNYDLDDVVKEIKDKAWEVKYAKEEKKEEVKIVSAKVEEKKEMHGKLSTQEEIRKAIERLQS